MTSLSLLSKLDPGVQKREWFIRYERVMMVDRTVRRVADESTVSVVVARRRCDEIQRDYALA
jgi:hypothetical protein